MGIGRKMIEWIKEKIRNQGRKNLLVIVPETNLGFQLFLRACGLKATKVKQGYFHNPEQDAIYFTYHA